MAKPMTRQRRLKAAKHEAGHAIINLLCGCQFQNIEVSGAITPDQDMSQMVSGNKAAGVIRGAGGGMNDREYVVMCMAGVAGERVKRQKPGKLTFADIFCGAESDWRDAKGVCTPHHIQIYEKKPGRTVDQYMDECLALAHELILQYKDVHTALVEGLMEKGKLTYAECREIWEQHEAD